MMRNRPGKDKVIARPGPHITAELTYFGIPERIIWDPAP